jgi:type II secretory pathway pseudopilin PulG
MAMVGILALSLFVSLKVAFKAQAAASRAVEPSRTSQEAIELICRDLASAVPPGGKLANTFLGLTDPTAATTGASAAADTAPLGPLAGTVNGAFEGTQGTDDRGNAADDLLFFTTAESPTHIEGANGDMKYVELKVVPSQAGTDYLLVRRVYNNLLSQTIEEPDQEVICRGVAGFNLRYYDPVLGEWEDNWDCSQYNNALPAAIEVTLQLDRPDASGQSRILTFTRIVQMPCSVAYSLLDSTTATP